MNSLAYLGFSSIHDIERMTLAEYYLRLEAHQLARLERREDLATQAWFNQSVQATTKGKHPNPVFKKFDQVFDRHAQEEEIRKQFADTYTPLHNPTKREQGAIFLQRYREFKKLKAEGRIDPNAWKTELKEADRIE